MDTSWVVALITIIGIDLVLAGDNAVVIGMASRNLPADQRNKAILWGTFGAVGVRVVLTAIAVFLLKVPLLMAIGGLLLVYVAVKLLVEDEGTEEIKSAANLYQAVKTIIVADIIMGLDNVLAIAGASHGNFWLILIGLAISIPIVVWGSQLISNLMNKYPILVTIGAAIIAYTAGAMFTHDSIIQQYLNPTLELVIKVGAVVFVLAVGRIWKNKRAKDHLAESKQVS